MTSAVPGEMVDRIIVGDCLDILPTLPAGSVDLITTSPPYPGQRGDTRTVSEWLEWFDEVTAAMVQVLKDDGVLALNVMFKRDEGGWFDTRLLTEVPALLKQNGLNMMDVYIFGKPNPAPNGNVERNDPPAWEPVFVGAKSPDYHFRPYRAPHKPKSIGSNGLVYSTRGDNITPHPDGARQSNLLIMSASADQNRPKAEGQSFPLALPERFILQHTRPGEVVLDPFSGAGTTCRAAQLHGRRYIGIELKPGEAEKAREWLRVPFQPALVQVNGAAVWSAIQ
jgi:DNA modification methylase